jgi:hypothetical protein
MQPYGDWFRNQKQPASGTSCCSDSDGRPVDARIEGDHWQAHITAEHFPGVRDQWIPIPDERVIRSSNPTGRAVVWLYVPHHWTTMGQCEHCSRDDGPDQGAALVVYCFAPPDGV